MLVVSDWSTTVRFSRRWSAMSEAFSNFSGFTSTTCSWVVALMLTCSSPGSGRLTLLTGGIGHGVTGASRGRTAVSRLSGRKLRQGRAQRALRPLPRPRRCPPAPRRILRPRPHVGRASFLSSSMSPMNRLLLHIEANYMLSPARAFYRRANSAVPTRTRSPLQDGVGIIFAHAH